MKEKNPVHNLKTEVHKIFKLLKFFKTLNSEITDHKIDLGDFEVKKTLFSQLIHSYRLWLLLIIIDFDLFYFYGLSHLQSSIF